MREWKEEEISRILREMPRGRVSSGFTERVMARMERPRPPALVTRPMGLALVSSGFLGIALAVWWASTLGPQAENADTSRVSAPASRVEVEAPHRAETPSDAHDANDAHDTNVAARTRQEAELTRQRLERLRAEYRELQSELHELRVLVTEQRPMIELGGTSEMDFVLDVGELAKRDSIGPSPVTHRERE